jgi:predicted naringenin-chalcone synthase
VQKLVAARQWGKCTEVLHAYHMGCYAAHPALRIAAGQLASQPASARPVDIVHTELCSLHLDLTRCDPAQLVIQSLFADGYMRYALQRTRPARAASFELLALQDEVLPDSATVMTWAPGPFHFAMTLSKDVPRLFAGALPEFVKQLFQRAGLRAAVETPNAVFAIHPGGPLILEWSQKALALRAEQLRWSRDILRRHGNISSATLPHIWQAILNDHAVPDGTLVVSVGAGPGLTLSGALFRKRQPHDTLRLAGTQSGPRDLSSRRGFSRR